MSLELTDSEILDEIRTWTSYISHVTGATEEVALDEMFRALAETAIERITDDTW